MPGTNKILRFAASASNVLTQEEYDDDVQRGTGHVPGIARSQLANKEAKQATAMAAGLGQFVAERQDADVHDGLEPEAFSAMLAEAVTETVPLASTEVAGRVELANATETQAAGTGGSGQRDDAAVTPAGLKTLTATQTRRGLAEIATADEVNTGTDNTRIVTPAGLAQRVATTLLSGIVELATSEETAAGVDPERAVTPKGLADLFAAGVSLASPGYVTFPNGFIVQWGTVSSTGTPTVVFPLEFPNACFGVQINGTSRVDCGVDSVSDTGFIGNAGGGGETLWWFAYGH